MTQNLNKLNLLEAHNGLQNKEFTARELLDDCIARIKTRQPQINTFITTTYDLAKEQADWVDKKISRQENLGFLEGIPCAIKDNILLSGVRCTAGSHMLSNYEAAYDAFVVEKLKKQNFVCLGKTNMDEFAMGSSTENSYFGPTKNPHNLDKVPGGSSGGSAAAVADDQCIYALGSDTGGSVRQPAALCGIVGLKPTYGRVSRFGLIAMASSFDQIGTLTKTVKDAAYVFDAIYGPDSKDATTINKKATKPFYQIEKKAKGLTIGIADEFFVDGMDERIKELVMKNVADLEKQGVKVVPVSMPYIKYALAVYYLIMPAEVSSNLARFDGIRYGYQAEIDDLAQYYLKTRSEGFGDEVKRRLILGTYVLSAGYYDAYYKKAQQVRDLIVDDFAKVFSQVDCLVTPTTPAVAFDIGLKTNDPLTMYLEDIFTVPVNVAGLPALSVPCGLTKEKLPVGMQLIAPHFQEATLFKLGLALSNN